MTRDARIRIETANASPAPFVRWFAAFVIAAATALCCAQERSPASSVVLDRAVAVVNNRVILASDLDDEIRLSILDPNSRGGAKPTELQALQQLVSRALIEQQIRQEDMPAIEPTPAEVDARLREVRTQIPACVRLNCASEAGWKAFLAAHGLTEERVRAYLRYRMEILRFIEERFRQGIEISPQQVETYYHDTLAPQYASGELPPLNQVTARIQEILIEQQVNVLFDNWLANLRRQGDVEVIDPKLAAEIAQDPVPAAAPAMQAPPIPVGTNGVGR